MALFFFFKQKKSTSFSVECAQKRVLIIAYYSGFLFGLSYIFFLKLRIQKKNDSSRYNETINLSRVRKHNVTALTLNAAKNWYWRLLSKMIHKYINFNISTIALLYLGFQPALTPADRWDSKIFCFTVDLWFMIYVQNLQTYLSEYIIWTHWCKMSSLWNYLTCNS